MNGDIERILEDINSKMGIIGDKLGLIAEALSGGQPRIEYFESIRGQLEKIEGHLKDT